jgi:hypothetical protein
LFSPTDGGTRMEIESVLIYAFITIFTLGLLVISFLNYWRNTNKKLFFVIFNEIILIFLFIATLKR